MSEHRDPADGQRFITRVAARPLTPAVATITEKTAIRSLEQAGEIHSPLAHDLPAGAVTVVSESLETAFISNRRAVLSLAPAVMQDLVEKTQLTVVVSLLGRSGPVVALVEEPAAAGMLVTVRIGAVLPSTSAQSRVLVAFQSERSAVAHHLADMSGSKARAEEAELAKARKDRVAWAGLEHLGITVVAAPVFGSRDVQAAMAIVGTTETLPKSDTSAQLVRHLRMSANRLSELVSG